MNVLCLLLCRLPTLKGVSSIGHCYTAMHNPNGEVCDNQDENIQGCENKLWWSGGHGRYSFFHYSIKSPTLFTCFCLSRVTNTGRWNSISGAASPYLYLLIDQGANVIPAITSDTGCALCLCTGTTGAWGIMNNTVS